MGTFLPMSSIELTMSALRTIDFSAVVLALKEAVPGLSAVYTFGSQVSDEAGPESVVWMLL